MTEDVIINIAQKGADVAEQELVQLAKAADKASVSTNLLTGKSSAVIESLDKQTGVTKRLVVEEGKLVSATESVTTTLKKKQSAIQAVHDSLAQNSSATAAATTGVRGYGSALGGLIAAAGITTAIVNLTKAVIDQAQALNQTAIQLRAYTQTTAEYNAVSGIFNSAVGASATSLAGLTSAFAELRASSAFVRVESAQIAAILVNANTAIRAGGLSAKEAAAGTNEYAKALADGRISGEEFAAIQIKFPELARAITRETGMSAETIKVLGINANTASAALERASEALRVKAEANQTVQDRVDKVTTALAASLLAFDKQTGASTALASALTFVAENMDKVIDFVKALTVALGALTVAVKLLDTALTSLIGGPIGKAIVAITAMTNSSNALEKQLNATTAATKNGSAAAEASAKSSDAAAAGYKREAAAASSAAAAKQKLGNAGGNIGDLSKETTTAQQRMDAQTAKMPLNARDGVMRYNDTMRVDGFRADGGPVSRRKTYVVGENGPETFVPGVSGAILPNGQGRAVGNDNGAGASRALDMLSQAFATGLAETNKLLGELVDYNKKTATATQTVAAAVDSAKTATASGTSGINNFGIPGMVAPAAAAGGGVGGGAGYYPMGGAASAGGGTAVAAGKLSAKDVESQIRLYGKPAAELYSKYMLATMNKTASEAAIAKAQYANYLSNVPNNLSDAVNDYAKAAFGPVQGGGSVNFRSGGAFSVPGVGTGGPDSRVVPMAVTPGEQVNVRTRAQVQADERANNDNRGGDTYIINIETKDADSFKRSEKQVLREFVRKAGQATRS